MVCGGTRGESVNELRSHNIVQLYKNHKTGWIQMKNTLPKSASTKCACELPCLVHLFVF